MIEFSKHQLDNGLKIILHQDNSTPMVALNVMYDVGSRDEDPEHTGFAHLFEHLMFSGSLNIPDFDIPIQKSGGENNAYTSADLTTFYTILPASNLDIGLWLESDRMMQLAFKQDLLDIQKKVVVEEFKETCLNVPYGKLWHDLSEMCYTVHPYQWPTIGKEFSHIERAEMNEVKSFFQKFYHPGNAVLALTGNFDEATIVEKIKKWFGPIPGGIKNPRALRQEPEQRAARKKISYHNVPKPSISLAFPMVGRMHKDYYTYDLISDIFSTGKSSRLFNKLVKQENLFSSVGAFISGSFDPGLFVVEGKINDGVSTDQAKEAIWNMLEEMKNDFISDQELEKIKNKVISTLVYSEISIINKGINLCTYELLGDASMINEQIEHYTSITKEDIRQIANECFQQHKCNELYILPLESKPNP